MKNKDDNGDMPKENRIMYQIASFGMCLDVNAENFDEFIPSNCVLSDLLERMPEKKPVRVSRLILPVQKIKDPSSVVQDFYEITERNEVEAVLAMFVVESENRIQSKELKEPFYTADNFIPLFECEMDQLSESLKRQLKHYQKNEWLTLLLSDQQNEQLLGFISAYIELLENDTDEDIVLKYAH